MVRDKILEFLRKKSGYASGEDISQRLGISRQALWKHIQELKDLGYDIAAIPHLGYQLLSSPDRLFPQEISAGINTKFIAKKIYYFDTLPSTMDTAVDLGIKGVPGGALIVAEAQTKGRGRLGREWFSPKYKGIYLSLILRPDILPNQASIFTLLAGVSVCEAVKEVSAIDAQIKWPNDILINNKKLGGILTELNAETDKVHFIVIGIGININNDKKAQAHGAVSLNELSRENISRIELLQEVLRRIEENYLLFQKKGNRPIIEKWRQHNTTLGKRVKVFLAHGQIEAEAKDIDDDGSLIIRNDAGLIEKVTAGDVVYCR